MASIARGGVDNDGDSHADVFKGWVELDGDSSGSTIAECCFNLVNNVAGAGLLTLSAGMARGVGAVPAAALALGLGVLSAATFSMIGWSCEALGQTTFGGLWDATLGHGSAWAIDAMISLMCLSAVIVYSGIIGDVLTPLFATLVGHGVAWNRRAVHVVASAAVVLLPLCLAKSLAFLAYTSLLGLAAVIYTAGFIAWRALDGSYAAPASGGGGGGALCALLEPAARPVFEQASAWGLDPKIFVLFSNLGLAYIAHYNAPKFYSELERASPARFNKVIAISFVVLATLYTSVMLLGHATFGDVTRSNILLNYAEADGLAFLGRIATALSILCGYPLAFVGLRDAVVGMATHAAQGGSRLGAAIAAPTARAPLTVALMVCATTIAALLTDIGIVVGVTGALMGSAIVYVVPALIFVRAAKVSGVRLPRAVELGTNALVPFGGFLAMLGLYFTLREFL